MIVNRTCSIITYKETFGFTYHPSVSFLMELTDVERVVAFQGRRILESMETKR